MLSVMHLFRYRQDRLPVLLFSLLFAADIAVFLAVDHPALLFTWTLLGIWPKGWICSFNHHHQHLPTFRQPVLNRLLEVVFSLHTGMTSHSGLLHHVLGHHANYLDQAKDESRWQGQDGRPMGIARYTLEVTLTSYTRAWQVSRKYRHHRPVFVGMLLLVAVILLAAFAWKPWAALFVLVLPMIISLSITSWATYTHHAGRDVGDHFVASTNIMNRAYNVLTGNLGYHTAHHYRGGVHWSQLPALHEEIKHHIPPDAYLQPGPPFSWGQPLDIAPCGGDALPAE